MSFTTHQASSSFSLLDLLRGLFRRKLWLLTCTAAGIGLGFAINTVFKPTYVAEARVLIGNQSTPYDLPSGAQTLPRDNLVDERLVNSQVSVLESRDLAQRVVQGLGLAGQPEFDSLARGMGKLQTFMVRFGFSDDPRLMTEEQRAVKTVMGDLTVYAVPLSNVVGIKYKGASGKSAADVANTLAETYVIATREEASGSTSRAREWLSEQINVLRDKVAKSDAAVEKYRADAGLLKGATTTLGAQQISELNTQITLADAARSEAEARAAEIKSLLRNKGSVDSSSEVLSSPTIQRLREQQVLVERKIADLSATYLPAHPKMQSARQEAANIQRQLRSEALKVVDGLQGQAKIAAARAQSLRKSLDDLKAQAGNSLQDEVKLNELEREAKANRGQLETMLARYADSNTRQDLALQPGYARVIQTAVEPTSPTFPKFGPIMLLSTLIGLGFGLGIAFLLEMMAQASRVNTRDMQSAAAANHRGPARHVAERAAVPVPSLDLPPRTVPPPVEDVAPFAPAATVVTPASFTPVAPAVPPRATPLSAVEPTLKSRPVTALVTPIASVPTARTPEDAKALLHDISERDDLADSIVNIASRVDAASTAGLRACAFAGIGASCELPVVMLAVARTLANDGKKVIAIDLDSRRRLLPELMALPYAPGLSELASGASDFTKSIQRDTVSPLQVLRYGQPSDKAPIVLADRMEAITTTLTGIYDCVLLLVGDATPAALDLIKGCGSMVLCAEQSRLRDAQAAAATLQARGIEQVALVAIAAPAQVAA